MKSQACTAVLLLNKQCNSAISLRTHQTAHTRTNGRELKLTWGPATLPAMSGTLPKPLKGRHGLQYTREERETMAPILRRPSTMLPQTTTLIAPIKTICSHAITRDPNTLRTRPGTVHWPKPTREEKANNVLKIGNDGYKTISNNQIIEDECGFWLKMWEQATGGPSARELEKERVRIRSKSISFV